MAHTLKWSLTAQIPGGPNISSSQTFDIEAYDSISLDVVGGAVNIEVQLQPSTTANQVSALVIISDHYSPQLNYRVNVNTNPEILVDQPQILMGTGAVGLLDLAPTSLFFSNNLAETVAIKILVGRDATP